MRLSDAQLNLFWRIWGAACRAQNWDRSHGFSAADIGEKRHEMLRDLGFASLKDVDQRDGFDRLLARVRVLAGQIKGAIDEVDPHQGDRRRLLYRMQCLIKCLQVYMHADAAAKYVHKICTDKFAWRGAITRGWEELDHRPRTAPALRGGGDRLRPAELEELIITISGRLNGKGGFRSKAGDSVHHMLKKAGLECDCAVCAAGRDATPLSHASPIPTQGDSPVTVRRRSARRTAVPNAAIDETQPF